MEGRFGGMMINPPTSYYIRTLLGPPETLNSLGKYWHDQNISRQLILTISEQAWTRPILTNRELHVLACLCFDTLWRWCIICFPLQKPRIGLIHVIECWFILQPWLAALFCWFCLLSKECVRGHLKAANSFASNICAIIRHVYVTSQI